MSKQTKNKVDEGDWIYLHRSTLDSKVFSDATLFRVWTWCLLKSNWKPKWFRGREIKPGQFATGRSSAADETGLSGSAWYRQMQRLSEMGNIKIENVNNRFSIVSIVNWCVYQREEADSGTTDGQPPDSQRTTGEQLSDTIEEREEGKKERTVSLSSADELFAVIPPALRTNAVEDAVLDWQKKRTDSDGKLIGLDSIELKHALFSLGKVDEEGVLMALSNATQGGWKSLRRDDGRSNGKGSAGSSGRSARKSISQMRAEAKGDAANV